MRYRIETTAPEKLSALPFVWSVKPAKDGSFTVDAGDRCAAALRAVPGVTVVEGLDREITADLVTLTLTPEAVAALRQLWEQTPHRLTRLGVLQIEFGD